MLAGRPRAPTWTRRKRACASSQSSLGTIASSGSSCLIHFGFGAHDAAPAPLARDADPLRLVPNEAAEVALVQEHRADRRVSPPVPVLVATPTVIRRLDPVRVEARRYRFQAVPIREEAEHSEHDLLLPRLDDGPLAWVLWIGRVGLDDGCVPVDLPPGPEATERASFEAAMGHRRRSSPRRPHAAPSRLEHPNQSGLGGARARGRAPVSRVMPFSRTARGAGASPVRATRPGSPRPARPSAPARRCARGTRHRFESPHVRPA